MKKDKLGQEPAFPIPDYIMQNCGAIDFNPMGMSKRFYAACAAMQGILSGAHEELIYTSDQRCDKLAEVAYQYADAILMHENK